MYHQYDYHTLIKPFHNITRLNIFTISFYI
nr:MAG TPA: hypothetical protein [Caudoviricetes sp.]